MANSRRQSNQDCPASSRRLPAEHTANGQIHADVQKLLAGASAGPGPGQVIVNESDLDALTSTAGDIDASVRAGGYGCPTLPPMR